MPEGAEPIALGNQYPLAIDRLSLRPQAAAPSSLARCSLSAIGSNTSIERDGHYVIDAETYQLPLTCVTPLGDRSELGVMLPLRWRGGGRMDRLIEGWHDLYRLPQGDRPGLPTDRFAIRGNTRDRGRFDWDESGWDLLGPELSIKSVVIHREQSELALLTVVKLPAPAEDAPQEPELLSALLNDYALSERTTLFIGAAGVVLFDRSVGGITSKPFHFEGFLSLSHQLAENVSVMAGLYGHSGLIENLPSHPDMGLYFDVGARIGARGSRWSYEVLMRENPAFNNGTPDVSFLVGVSARLGAMRALDAGGAAPI